MSDQDFLNPLQKIIKDVAGEGYYEKDIFFDYEDEAPPEDFVFSITQLRLRAKTAESRGHYLLRLFINGKEFTQRGPSVLKSSFDDAVIVASRVEDASEEVSDHPEFLLTYQKASPGKVLRYLNKRYPAKKERWVIELSRMSRQSR